MRFGILAGIGKSKPTPICPYVLHLYYAHDTTLPEDKKAYMVGESMMRHYVEPDEEEQSGNTEDLEHESLDLEEVVELLA